MAAITRYDFANIGVKLLALFMLVSFLSDLPSYGVIIEQFIAMKSSHSMIFALFVFSLPLLGLLFPALLWWLAGPIARLMSKTSRETTASTSGADLLETLIIAIGVLLLTLSVPKLLVLLSIVLQDQAHSFDSTLPQLIAYGGQFVLSLLLIFSARPLRYCIHKLRYSGLGKAS